MLDFFQDVLDHFRAFGLQLLSHPAKCDTDDIAVMQLRPYIFITQFEP